MCVLFLVLFPHPLGVVDMSEGDNVFAGLDTFDDDEVGVSLQGFDVHLPNGRVVRATWLYAKDRAFFETVKRRIGSKKFKDPRTTYDAPPDGVRMHASEWKWAGLAQEHPLWELVRGESFDVFGVYYSDLTGALGLDTVGKRIKFSRDMVSAINASCGKLFPVFPMVTSEHAFPQVSRDSVGSGCAGVIDTDKIVPLSLIPFLRSAVIIESETDFAYHLNDIKETLYTARRGRANTALVMATHAQFVANESSARSLIKTSITDRLTDVEEQCRGMKKDLRKLHKSVTVLNDTFAEHLRRFEITVRSMNLRISNISTTTADSLDRISNASVEETSERITKRARKE